MSGSLYSEVQCIMGDGHMGQVRDCKNKPREQTDRHEKKHDLPTTSLAGGKNKKSHKPAIQAEIQHDRLPAIIARITIFVISPVI